MNEIEKYGYTIRLILHRKNMKAEDLVFFINQKQSNTINKSTLSRIMTGKRLLTTMEADCIARELDLPVLFEAYQYLKDYIETNNGVSALRFHEAIDQIRSKDAVRNEIAKPRIDYSLLQQMISRLYQYCLVNDISEHIREGFAAKISQVHEIGEMSERLILMYECFLNGKILDKERAWIAVALLYFISPIDLISIDYMPFCYMDDEVVVTFIFNKLHSVLMEFRNSFVSTCRKSNEIVNG